MTSNSTSYAGCWLSNSFAFYLTLHAGKYTPHQNARQRTKRQDTLASLHVALQMITPMRWSGTGSQPRVAGAGAARAPACGKACCRAPRCTPATLMQPAAATAGSTPSICPTAPLSPAARWRRCTCTAKMMVSGQRVAGRQQCCCRLMTAPACQNSTMPQDEYAPHALECSLGICKFSAWWTVLCSLQLRLNACHCWCCLQTTSSPAQTAPLVPRQCTKAASGCLTRSEAAQAQAQRQPQHAATATAARAMAQMQASRAMQ